MSFRVNPCRALSASVPSSRARITKHVLRSTRLLTAEPLRAPLMRSPSQWPGTCGWRLLPDARQSVSCWESDPADLSHAHAANSSLRSEPRGSTDRAHKWSRPRDVSACCQNTRDGGARQSARAITRHLADSTNRSLEAEKIFGKFWIAMWGNRLLPDIAADDCRQVQAQLKTEGQGSLPRLTAILPFYAMCSCWQ